MQAALAEARLAAEASEVPIGQPFFTTARLLREVRTGFADNDPTAHAEIVAIREAARNAWNYRLNGLLAFLLRSNRAPCRRAR